MFEQSLEERCHEFGKRGKEVLQETKMDPGNFEDVKQLVRASGSVGANYIEANENVGKGDLIYRIRVCRKESKECMHFLGAGRDLWRKGTGRRAVDPDDEASQLKRIFSTVLTKIIENNRE